MESYSNLSNLSFSLFTWERDTSFDDSVFRIVCSVEKGLEKAIGDQRSARRMRNEARERERVREKKRVHVELRWTSACATTVFCVAPLFFFERNIVPSLTNVSSKHPSRDFQDVSPPPPHPPLCFFNIVITDFDFLNFSNLLKNCIIRIIRGKVSPRESFEERKVGSFPVVVTPSDRLFNISGRNQPYKSVALAGWPSHRPRRPRYITDG